MSLWLKALAEEAETTLVPRARPGSKSALTSFLFINSFLIHIK
jgi:hypothetical protein